MKTSKAGIYKITNTVNGKIYIGRSIDIPARWSQHKSDFRKARRTGVLYDAFGKYGIEKFSFEILEPCGKEVLLEREKFWIKELQANHRDVGYNRTIGGDGILGASEETRRKIGLSSKLRNSGEGNPAYGKPRPAHVLAAAKAVTAKTYKLESPAGEEITVTSLNQFAKDNGLNQGALWNTIRNKTKHKGWRVLERF